MLTSVFRVGVKRMEPDSFQWCPVRGQGATGTNWRSGSSVWTWGRPTLLWVWQSTGTGCPEVWWILFPWRYSRPNWMQSCAACSRWPCFGSRGWTRCFPEVPSNPYHSMILWFIAKPMTYFSISCTFNEWGEKGTERLDESEKSAILFIFKLTNFYKSVKLFHPVWEK